MSGPVPLEWTRLCGNHHAAIVAAQVMKDPGATQIARDDAVIRYSRAADAIIADLSALSERQELGRITLLLSKRERK